MERIDIPGCGSICIHEIFPGIVINYEEFKCKELLELSNASL